MDNSYKYYKVLYCKDPDSVQSLRWEGDDIKEALFTMKALEGEHVSWIGLEEHRITMLQTREMTPMYTIEEFKC